MTVRFGHVTLELALAGLFPPDVAVAAEPIGTASGHILWPIEEHAITGVLPARRAEFAAGRTAARRALAGLGVHPGAIPMASSRAPVWPDGTEGSIAHCRAVAVAAARRGGAGGGIGLDVEENHAVEPDLWPLICSPEELADTTDAERGVHVARVFCAKEAAYKAQFALTSCVFDFHTLALRKANGGFVARFQRRVGCFSEGDEIEVRQVLTQGMVLSGAVT